MTDLIETWDWNMQTHSWWVNHWAPGFEPEPFDTGMGCSKAETVQHYRNSEHWTQIQEGWSAACPGS